MWTKVFKVLGIYDRNYHEEYRKYIHSKRYKTYINLVANDIQESIRNANKKEIAKLVFTIPTFKIEDRR